MSKSILIVEDEETLRESIKRIFTKEGFTVDAAESAEQGLSLLETNAYDVIISDIILPGMDGIEMLITGAGTDPGPDLHRRDRLCLARHFRQGASRRRLRLHHEADHPRGDQADRAECAQAENASGRERAAQARDRQGLRFQHASSERARPSSPSWTRSAK